MKIKPVKGTSDYLPQEVELRESIKTKILEVYSRYGFQKISTPIIEDLQNLNKSEGGENLSLMFKIQKRGKKLKSALEKNEEPCDMGLRYDLTLPLSRYYANNKDELICPFKSIQVDRVYRAEQPQQGRLREFIQYDIDIIGDNSNNAEIELIYVTAKALINVGITDFKIKINDKKILLGVFNFCGFLKNEYETACIIVDKLNKIGIDGVKSELLEKLANLSAVDKLVEILSSENISLEKISEYLEDKQAITDAGKIIDSVKNLCNGEYTITYDFSLVRGQGYYTGTVFEIESKEYNCSIAGGGRYDNLIGKFTNENIPAVGFSIGFERIYSLLCKNRNIKRINKKAAIIYYCDVLEAIDFAEKMNCTISIFKATKKTGKLISRLQEGGYERIIVMSEDRRIREV